MPSRRMFSLRIVNSAKFLKMPATARLLYYDLCMRADDDGIVEAYTVMTSVGCKEDDLRVLVSKDFVKILNEDLVTYITDWTENNHIRPDRKVDSIYKDLLISVYPDTKLIERKERSDLKKNKMIIDDMDSPRTVHGQPMDSIGKVRLGKVRLGKVRLGESIEPSETASTPTKEIKHKFGEYNHVKLTDKEYDTLKNDFGIDETKEAIKYLDEYIEMKGTKYTSHYMALRKWVFDAVKEKKRKNTSTSFDEALRNA